MYLIFHISIIFEAINNVYFFIGFFYHCFHIQNLTYFLYFTLVSFTKYVFQPLHCYHIHDSSLMLISNYCSTCVSLSLHFVLLYFILFCFYLFASFTKTQIIEFCLYILNFHCHILDNIETSSLSFHSALHILDLAYCMWMGDLYSSCPPHKLFLFVAEVDASQSGMCLKTCGSGMEGYSLCETCLLQEILSCGCHTS